MEAIVNATGRVTQQAGCPHALFQPIAIFGPFSTPGLYVESRTIILESRAFWEHSDRCTLPRHRLRSNVSPRAQYK